MSNGAIHASAGPTYKMLRELGARAHPTFASIREPRELLVVVRFGAPLPPTAIASIVQEADSLAKNWHPNIARVRHVDAAVDAVAIGSELVEGATLADLLAAARSRLGGGTGSGAPLPSSRRREMEEALPLPVIVRVVLDVLAGLHALHGLRDATNRRMGTLHGELCPTNIVVGRDGVARIIHALRPRPVAITERSEGLGHAAPETLEGGVMDARADVYAVGVILWEALTGRALFPEPDPARILVRQREEEIAEPWLAPELAYLGAVAMRALAFEPGLRFRTAAEMGAEIRRPKSAQIASGSVVATWVANLDGDRIRGRRNALDPSASGQRKRPTNEEIAAKLAAMQPEKPATPTAPTLPPGSIAEPPPPIPPAPIAAVIATPAVPRVIARPGSKPLLASAKPAPPTSRPAVPVARPAASKPAIPVAAKVVPVAPEPPPVAFEPPPPVVFEPPPPVVFEPPPPAMATELPVFVPAAASTAGMMAFSDNEEASPSPPARARRNTRPVIYAIGACVALLGALALATTLGGSARRDTAAKVPAVGVAVAAKQLPSPARTLAVGASSAPRSDLEPRVDPGAAEDAPEKVSPAPRPTARPAARAKRYEPLGI